MDITPLRLPDYLHDSEEDDCGSVKTYQTNVSDDDILSIDSIDHNTSDENEPTYSSLISELETSTRIAYYLNHLLPPKKWNYDAEEFIYSYIDFITKLGKVVKDDVIWIWNNPASFSYSLDYLHRVLRGMQCYIDKVHAYNGCELLQHCDGYDTMEPVNDFYVRLKQHEYDIPDVAPMKDNLRSCLKPSSSRYKDLIYPNHIFQAFCICDK